MHTRIFLASALVALALSSLSRTALAAEAATDVPERAREAPPEIAPRPWLYLVDPTLPSPLHVVAFSRATYSHADSPTRPFAANVAHPGGVLEVGGEIGATPWLSLAASGFVGSEAGGPLGALAGLRFAPFASRWRTTHAVVSGGYLHEISGGDGAWGRIAITQDVARARLAFTAHGEHVFQRGRDAIDLMVMAGASYRVAGPVRAGVEYVAQDLEGALDDEEAESGVRHFLGPTLALELLDQRLSIVGGPALGLGARSPSVLGRAAIAFTY